MSTNTQNGEQPETAEQVALRANAVIDGLRWSLANELGDSGHELRDWYDTFGWPNQGNNGDWDADNYYALYLRNAYAYGVVAQKPKTTWKHEPEVRDRADQEEDVQDESTDFERAITQLDREHDLWHYAHRVDRMAGIGRHGLLVIDYADTNRPEDFETAFTGVENASGLDMVNGYRVYPEPMIEDIDWGDPGSDRWGKPVEYRIDLGDDADAGTQDEEETTLRIHHSRVVDVPARVLDDDETRARPRQEPVLNNILDIEKALGSTAELSYRAADYGINVNLDPEKVDTGDDALEAMDEDLQDWYHGLQPFFKTTGAEVNRLGGEVKDPTGIQDANVRAIATQTGIPQRVLEGASLGELASAEKDDEQYLGMIAERQRQYAEPYIARAIIDHHLEDGVVPDYEGDWYDFKWPDLSELSEQEAATVKETRANVVANLQTAVPGLSGDRAEDFVETGEFPEREETTANQLDEDDPRVQEAFDGIVGPLEADQADQAQQLTANDFDQPRDELGQFASLSVGSLDTGSFDRTFPVDIDHRTRIRVGISKDKGRIIKFLAKLERQVGDETVEILRSDHNPESQTGHDVSKEGVHIDFEYGDKNSKTITGQIPPDEGLRAAQTYIRENYQTHIEEFEAWLKNQNPTGNLSSQSATRRPSGASTAPSSKRTSTSTEADFSTANAARYSEGDEVDTPDGVGVVVDAITESFEDTGGDQVEASDDSPVYAVLVEDEDAEMGFYSASEIEMLDGGIDVGVDNPEEQLTGNAGELHNSTRRSILEMLGLRANQEGHFTWPESWRESETPARLIALKAFAGMGGSFDACEREMRGEIAATDRFCADFIDRLVGHEYWRGDSWAPGD